METIDLIRNIITNNYPDSEVYIEDFSKKHSYHTHNELKDTNETHLKILIKSKELNNKPIIQRHRAINKLLKSLFDKRKIHALSIEFLR